MAKKSKDQGTEAELQPDELGALKQVAEEFVGKLQHIDNEVETLKEARRDIISEYKSKLDVKTFMLAMRVVKIKLSVNHKDTFDTFLEVLDPSADSEEEAVD